jgi:hypothetical protein
MPRFHVNDLRSIENAPTSPENLRRKIGDMILSSTVARARVETLNPETGEYRVVLQGTLDKEEVRPEER